MSKRIVFLLSEIEKALSPITIGEFEKIYDSSKSEIVINFRDNFGNYHHSNLYVLNNNVYVYYHCNDNIETIQASNMEEGLERLARMIILKIRDNDQTRSILQKYKMLTGEKPLMSTMIFQIT